MGMNKLQANLSLLCVTLLWSTEVVIFACIPDSVLPFATTCITSFIGAALLFLCFFKRIISSIKKDGFKLIRSCLLLSVLDCSYNVMYIYGLNDFDVSTGAFTLSMTAVVLPVILIMRKENVDLKTWISAGLVLAGIMFALARNLFNISIAGFLLIFIGCIIRAFFIVRLNHFAKKYDAISIAFTYTLPVGVISFIIWSFLQPETFAAIPWNREVIASLFIYSYFVVALAKSLNIFAQKRATPASATIIYSCEIIFSLIWGMTLPESLIDPASPDAFTFIGVAFIVLGNLVQVADFSKLKRKKEVQNETPG
ncbi:MAG: DMT family transporter [Ruminococcus sp.]|nr:DMT family transporter [Ruminococcus sp.]